MIRRTLLALTVLLLTSCFAAKETRDGSDRLAEAYGDTAGATLVRTESGRDGQGTEYVETVVSLEADATPEQIGDVIVGHPAAVEEAGLGDGVNNRYLRLELPDGGGTLGMKWLGGDPDEAGLREGVEHWLHVMDLVGLPAQLVLSSDGSELYGVEGEGPDAVSAIYRTLGGDPVMAADDAVWDVKSTDAGTALRLAIDVLPTEAQLASWDRLVASLGSLPRDFAATGLDVGIAGRATVGVDLTAPAGTAEESLTPRRYGELLWPALHEQLDALPGLHQDWGYFVDWAVPDSPASSGGLISLLSDALPTDNGDSTWRWSKAAYDYLHAP